MSFIQELSPHLADLIAAGEVVERPASVAKELVENAIDAGATRIQVEMERGGITYLRIMDNGCGIAAEDVPIAFRRHATSKLRTETDLSAIGTLGFRGEALAAIAAVTRIDLFTKPSDCLAGRHLHLEAGQIQVNEEAGCPDGTTIIIRDLFYNTPARMKFLKKDYTEAGYVIDVVEHAALSHPEIAFTIIRDGKQVFTTAGDGKLLTPVFGVFGREMTGNMVEVEVFQREDITVWGYITKPHFCRPNRSMQHFFVNGRYIKSRLLQAALEEAFRNKMITGKYPSCALFVQLPLPFVDVNVHPAKTEIKFAHEKKVFEAVYIACKNTLEKNDNIPVMQPSIAHKKTEKEDTSVAEQQQLGAEKIQTVPEAPVPTAPLERLFIPQKKALPAYFRPPTIECDADVEDTVSVSTAVPPVIDRPAEGIQKMPFMNPEITEPVIMPEKQKEVQNTPIFSSVKVIGEAFQTYIIAEDERGLILVDKHAAHERILFNKLRSSTHMPQQQLLSPYIADLSASAAMILKEHQAQVEEAGFHLSPFGENSFAVRAVPAYLDAADIGAVLVEMADKLSSSRNPTPDRLDDLIHTVACKAAIKAGKQTSITEMQQLCDQVIGDPDASCCPHGRPVTVRLTKYEIDKLFKRVNQ